ncbi:glycyl radical enzyme domain-containing protein [Escherichia coli]
MAGKKRAMLHAQSGISSDIGTTPGARLPYGDEPNPITHLQTVAPHHAYYYSGISDILTLDETIKRTRRHWYSFASVPLKPECGEFTANVSGNNLGSRYRLYGAFVGLRKISRRRFTHQHHLAGREAARNTGIPERQPRVISHEQQMRFSQ